MKTRRGIKFPFWFEDRSVGDFIPIFGDLNLIAPNKARADFLEWACMREQLFAIQNKLA